MAARARNGTSCAKVLWADMLVWAMMGQHMAGSGTWDGPFIGRLCLSRNRTPWWKDLWEWVDVD